LKCLEMSSGKIAFAEHKKRPAVAQDSDRAANRAVALVNDAYRFRP